MTVVEVTARVAAAREVAVAKAPAMAVDFVRALEPQGAPRPRPPSRRLLAQAGGAF